MNIWVDLENTPHVLILKPIIEKLELLGHKIFITARDCSQTLELADFFQLKVKRISHHHGKKKVKKILGHFSRISRLIHYARGKNISVAISHGSRSQILAAGLMKIPVFTMWDYEYADLSVINHFISCLAVPEVIPIEAFQNKIRLSKVVKYPGLKEHIYTSHLLASTDASTKTDFDPERIIITMRPPANDAHYHNHKTTELFHSALLHFSSQENTTIVITARTELQRNEIREFALSNGLNGNIKIPEHVYNGLELIRNSDIIVGGGGTMNREAAVLGVPVYSIFQGNIGAVDRFLAEIGKMQFINSIHDIKKIELKKKSKYNQDLADNRDLIEFLVNQIVETSNGI